MNYQLIDGSLNDAYNAEETVLRNRGIKDWKAYTHLDSSCVNDFSLLDNINEAVEVFLDTVKSGKLIGEIVD